MPTYLVPDGLDEEAEQDAGDRQGSDAEARSLHPALELVAAVGCRGVLNARHHDHYLQSPPPCFKAATQLSLLPSHRAKSTSLL